MTKKKDKKLRPQGAPAFGIMVGDPQQDDMMNKAKRLREDFGYSFNESINEAERTTRKQRADAGRPVSPADVRTKEQLAKYAKVGLRENTLEGATKSTATQAFIAQQNASFVKSQIEEMTGKKQTKTMGGFGVASSLIRGVPALVAASVMKPKNVASGTPSASDIKEQKRIRKRLASQITKK